MALPLQPDLNPWTVWQRRGIVLAALIAALALLALLGRPSQRNPHILAGNRGPDYLRTVSQLIDGAEQRIWVMVYVLYGGEDEQHPVNHLLARMAAAQARGVDVRIILDRGRIWGSEEIDPKHEQAIALIESYKLPVITDELERTSHAKIVLVDHTHAVVGSHNWTASALLRNREAAVWVQDATAITELEHLFASVPNFSSLAAPE